jgi:4-amino-4-deoxy-L-arabinose transferase-like glycosyltransferase
VSLAHANLLLLLAERRNPVLRTALFITVGFIALLAILIILPIATEGDIPGENGEFYWRILGVVAILDVLGTIVLPVINRFTRVAVGLTVRLGPDAAGKVARLSSAQRLTPEALVEKAIADLPE